MKIVERIGVATLYACCGCLLALWLIALGGIACAAMGVPYFMTPTMAWGAFAMLLIVATVGGLLTLAGDFIRRDDQ